MISFNMFVVLYTYIKRIRKQTKKIWTTNWTKLAL